METYFLKFCEFDTILDNFATLFLIKFASTRKFIVRCEACREGTLILEFDGVILDTAVHHVGRSEGGWMSAFVMMNESSVVLVDVDVVQGIVEMRVGKQIQEGERHGCDSLKLLVFVCNSL